MLLRKNIFKLIYIFLLTLFCFHNVALSAAAQNESKTSKSERPKIGLVLSGGGARGFAHIGVLKVLDRHLRGIAEDPRQRSAIAGR